MNLVCKPIFQGIMAYWDEVPNTAVYTIKLFINVKNVNNYTKTLSLTMMI